MPRPDCRNGSVRPVKLDDEVTSTARMLVNDSPALRVGGRVWVEHPRRDAWVEGRIARVFASEVEVVTL